MAWITIDGTRYQLPSQDDMTIDEMCLASDLGAKIPTGEVDFLDPRWIMALIVIAKKRAGEEVNQAAIGELRFGQIEWEGDADPPPNRAARRAAAKSGSPKTAAA